MDWFFMLMIPRNNRNLRNVVNTTKTVLKLSPLVAVVGCAHLEIGGPLLHGMDPARIDRFVTNQERMVPIREEFRTHDWLIYDKDGKVVGWFTRVRMEGLHFRQFASNERYFTSSYLGGPNLPEGEYAVPVGYED